MSTNAQAAPTNPGTVAAWNSFSGRFSNLSLEGHSHRQAGVNTHHLGNNAQRGCDNSRRVRQNGTNEAPEEPHERPIEPLRFYSPNGKLYYRLWDMWNSHRVDEEWNEKVVSVDPFQEEKFNKFGFIDRPTYVQRPGEPAREINWRRWRLIEPPKEGLNHHRNNTWFIEAMLNTHDFNPPVDERPPKLRPLNNRVGVPLDKIYPKGKMLLVKESRHYHWEPEWKEGDPLGLNKPHARKTHIGWVPPRYRQRRRGLGGDRTDSVQKHWFFGDLDVPLPDNFVEPARTWSENPSREVRMRSATGGELVVKSFQALKRKGRHPSTDDEDKAQSEPVKRLRFHDQLK
ncbi:hypothetical protein GGR54DRAFT_618849 [Hypoxylon sp. NC1633]|nr:hypothetical protein GGR54DRAFT_618849 [Hypoxylon sp. NC1633]